MEILVKDDMAAPDRMRLTFYGPDESLFLGG